MKKIIYSQNYTWNAKFQDIYIEFTPRAQHFQLLYIVVLEYKLFSLVSASSLAPDTLA